MGIFPRGGRTGYSTKPLSIPVNPFTERGPKYSSAFAPIAAKMYQYAANKRTQREFVGPYGDLDWIAFDRGYYEFRRSVGLNPNVVNLQLTGKMLDDMKIRHNIKQSNSKIIATTGRSGSHVTGEMLARIELSIFFDIVSSERVAHWVEFGKVPRQFRFWTDDEQNELFDTFRDLINRGQLERSRPGRFLPVSF